MKKNKEIGIIMHHCIMIEKHDMLYRVQQCIILFQYFKG